MKAAVGFVREGSTGGELLFPLAKFRDIVCDGLDDWAVIAALKAKGLLVVHEGGKSTVPRQLPAPLGRKRVICVKAAIERFADDNAA